jgi:ATP-dependent RNA helicase DeaD
LNTVPFAQWELRQELLDGLAAQDFTDPTPVQQEAFPLVLEGSDLLVQSRTGTGKTLAFGLPLLQRMAAGHGPVDALVVLPTRELALQVASALGKLARPLGIEVACLYGGGSYRDQNRALNQGARLVVGTPGRLCDHLDRGSLNLTQATTLVLDEADEMLDMGFADELDKITGSFPGTRQSLLFSATMAPEMRRLADKVLKNPKTLAVSTGLTSAPEITHVSYEMFREHRADALINILHTERPDLAIVFCHTKAETEELAERLNREGLKASHLNGDLPQAERTRTLNAFRRRQVRLLIATDVAARGIDVKGVSHVINLGVPQNPETYIHRTGRTGRAGAKGTAITFVQPRDGARFRRMLQSAGINIELRQVPQADDVRKVLRGAYHETVTARVAAQADDRLSTLAQELLAYIEPQDLVTALLAGDEAAMAIFEAGVDVAVPRLKPLREARPMPARQAGVPMAPRAANAGAPRAEVANRWAKGSAPAGDDGETGRKPPRKLSEHNEPGFTRIHLNQGKANRLMPGGLVQLVCSVASLKGESIGAIAIHAHFCFFDVKESEAPRVADLLTGLSYNGKKLKANLVPVQA